MERRPLRYVLALLGVLLLSGIAQAQQYLQLGSHSYSRAPAPHLQMMVGRGPAFFLAVGGVAFESVAVGRGGLRVAGLQYSAASDDGDRLRVILQSPSGDRMVVHARIYDWQLVPIARFAQSNYGSAMTLFGELQDKAFSEQILANGGRVINYHPAFDNTLLGLRLMQADIMLFDENAADLPRNSQGYVLGAGEDQPNVAVNRGHFEQIVALLKSEEKSGHTYSSYVTGDLDQHVEFFVMGDSLGFTGRPYWKMWDFPQEIAKARDELAMGDDSTGRALLKIKYRTDQALAAALAADELTLEAWDKSKTLHVDPELSKRVSAQVAQLNGINPTIYNALTTVMHYAALFRHYKAADPAGYASFVSSLQHVSISPYVQTPTVQREEGN